MKKLLTRAVSECKLSMLIVAADYPPHISDSMRREAEYMMPLTMAKAGETVTIKKITGKDEVRLHLAELGFVVDSEVTVVNEIAGNLIIQVKESRIALDKTMANRIMIG